MAHFLEQKHSAIILCYTKELRSTKRSAETFLDAISSSLNGVYKGFGGTCCLHFQC